MDNFDPFQIFEISKPTCVLLTVRVMRGRKITKGAFWDFDWPDPYVHMKVSNSAESIKWTKCITNESNPIWCEEFEFILNPNEKKNIMIISLMEGNYGPDSLIATTEFDLSELPFDDLVKKTFKFNWHGEVDMEFFQRLDTSSDLRFSLCLCDEEKHFLDLRLKRVFECLQSVLGEDAPKCLDEVPVIAIMGSGGGFRAMTAFMGVLKALEETRLLDCATYIAALSGSSWALSSLYAHPHWPSRGVGEIQHELKEAVSHSPLRLLAPQILYRYVERVLEKRSQGQPVSFTDFFGMMVGETLLSKSPHAKLSDQLQKVRGGRLPLPLYSGVHVKPDVSARVFQEWVEFTPFEIGLPKYGCYQPARDFGAKYYLGHIVKRYDEPPLHFLQGLWGSAFCILFKQLIKKDVEMDKKKDPVEILRREAVKSREPIVKPPISARVTYSSRKPRRSLENILKDCVSLSRSMNLSGLRARNNNQQADGDEEGEEEEMEEVMIVKDVTARQSSSSSASTLMAKNINRPRRKSSVQSIGQSTTDDYSDRDDEDNIGSDKSSEDSSDSDNDGTLELEKTENVDKKITKRYKTKKATAGFWQNVIQRILEGNNIQVALFQWRC